MPGGGLSPQEWFDDRTTEGEVHRWAIHRVLESRKTPFQELRILDCGSRGKALILDGIWQSCTRDEWFYHEALVHPACVQVGGPRRVLILGGGEGATLREVLKWRSVERAVMVDIDEEVVEACREHLPEMHAGSFEDPRTELVIGDAADYVAASKEGAWDLILSDVSDPVAAGPSSKLFTREFFEQCRRALAPGGALAAQGGSSEPPGLDAYARLARTVAAVFPHMIPYTSWVPSFLEPWGFVLGGETPIPTRPEPEAVDALLAEGTSAPLRVFDGIALLGMLQPPRQVRDAIAAGEEIFTLDAQPQLIVKQAPDA